VSERGRPNRQRLAAATAFAALVLALGALSYAGWRWLAASGLSAGSFTPEEAARLIRGFGSWAPIAAMLLMVVHSFVPLPAEVIALGNGMIFGPALGIAVTWSGAMLGAILSYALARWLGQPFVRALLPEKGWRRIETIPRQAAMLLLVRLIPVISFNLVNYAAGLAGIGWWPFLWTTAVGILPLTILMVVVGHSMAGGPWWLWLIVLVACAALWLAWHRRRPT
jgi:uncharacterized membrane protein YdjX (TVP38/TMEM64 family)